MSEPLSGCSFKRVIKTCDLMGGFITFRINDENEFKSLIGGFCSIFFIIFTIFYVIYSAIPFLRKENINFIYATKVLSSGPLVDLGSKKAMLAISLYYQDPVLEDETPAFDVTDGLIGYRMVERVWDASEAVIDTHYPMEFCKKESFPAELGDFFDWNVMDEMFCPDMSVYPMEEFKLEGLYTDEYSKYYLLEVYITDYGKEHLDEVEDAMKEQMEFGM
ncbi:MAG: hypothetical protein MJ252_22690 [archaeon]|nr:hypothetical protein [archaeon]